MNLNEQNEKKKLVDVPKKVLRQYQSKSAIREVLGCFLLSPNLLDGKTYLLSEDKDFGDFPETFHQIIFSAINNKAKSKAKTLDAQIIDEYLKDFPVSYSIFTKNNGVSYIEKAMQLANTKNLESNYNEVKKFTLLRNLLLQGFNVSDYFDPNETDPDIIAKKRIAFDSKAVEDIIREIKIKLVTLNNDFNVDRGRTSIKAGEGALEQKEEWKKNINYGLSYFSDYLTTITYGIREKRFCVLSAGTGVGKTRLSVANLCRSFVSRYYDKNDGEWKDNPHGTQNRALYIGTEMELKEEVQPILLAYIADVPEEHILLGKYEDGEEERVDEAIKVLDDSYIWLEYIPNYDLTTMENVIEAHVERNRVTHLFFDYIHVTANLTAEYATQSKAKMILREDQILANLSNTLKNLCRKYNISIDTWTQVSGDFKNEQNRDQTIVRGAKSILDKADIGGIVSEPTVKELKLLENITRSKISVNGVPNIPNICLSIYKNRGGRFNKVKIWLWVDYSTMRVHDLFVTDYNYKLNDSIKKNYVLVVEDKKIVFDNVDSLNTYWRDYDVSVLNEEDTFVDDDDTEDTVSIEENELKLLADSADNEETFCEVEDDFEF